MWRGNPGESNEIRLERDEIVLPARSCEKVSGLIFGYPTRLCAAWRAEISVSQVGYEAENRPPLRLPIIPAFQSFAPGTKNPVSDVLRDHRRLTERRKSVEIEGMVFDARFENSANVAHALKIVAPSALAARRVGIEPTIVLHAGKETLLDLTLQALGFRVVRTAACVVGDHLVGLDGGKAFFEPYYLDLYDSYPAEPGEALPKRVFIGRKKGRTLENEAEIVPVLQEFGFETFYFEELPLTKQFRLMSCADCVVALHGAAMAHLVFNHRRPKVLEIFHPGYVTHAFRYMTWSLGGSWAGVTGKLTPDVVHTLDELHQARAFATGSTTVVDPECVRRALEYLDISKQESGS